MKTKMTLFFLLLTGLNQVIIGQVTEGEAILRDLKTDTIKGWKYGGVTALNLAQTSLTNWAAGGENSFAVNGLFSVFANYKKDKTIWDNSLDIGYGLLKQGSESDFMKTDDKFDLLSKYGRRASQDFYYAALINFKTQMTEGKDYAADTSKISNFLAPAYLLGAIGMDYKPNSYLSAFLAPLTGKITIVNDQDLADAGAFGVEPATYDANSGALITKGENSKSEFGGYIRVIYSKNDFEQELLKNVSLMSKIDIFSNYLENPQNIDISWETQIAFNINKYISVNINTHLIYDDDIDIVIDDKAAPRVQFKEIFGLGFSYKF